MTKRQMYQLLRGSSPKRQIVIYCPDTDTERPAELKRSEYGGPLVLQPEPETESE